MRIKREDAEDRPLVLLGHSLGGLLINQALINAYNNPKCRHIWGATTGLAFFATLRNRGNKMPVNISGVLAKIAIDLGFQRLMMC